MYLKPFYYSMRKAVEISCREARNNYSEAEKELINNPCEETCQELMEAMRNLDKTREIIHFFNQNYFNQDHNQSNKEETQ